MTAGQKKSILASLVVFAALFWAGPALAQDVPPKLADTGWLAASYGKLDVRIIDMRPDIRDYWTSHLPGALYLNPEALRWPEKGVPAKLLPPDALAELLSQMGIGPSTVVVLYSEKNGFMPFYLLWALDYIGHKASCVLDGGFEKWKGENRFLTQDYPTKTKPVTYPVPQKLRSEVRATLEEVKNSSAAGARLVDARPPETFTGEKGSWKRRGHLPGAINHFWSTDLTADGGWKSKEELRDDYAAAGVTPDKKIIVYCGSGQMSSHTYFVLKYILGFPSVKNYDGGFEEWSNDPALPVEKSKK